MNRRQLLTASVLGALVPKALALPAGPAVESVVIPAGQYSVHVVGTEIQDDKLIVRMKIIDKTPPPMIVLSFVTPKLQ